MKYRQVGKTGLRVSKLCLRALTFGRETTEEDSFKILSRFAEEGDNFVDTADVLITASKISGGTRKFLFLELRPCSFRRPFWVIIGTKSGDQGLSH